MSTTKMCNVPRWLSTRMRKAGYKKNGFGDCLMISTGFKWLDHWGSTTFNGKSAFISEPYWIEQESMLQILQFAEQMDCEVTIRGEADWFHRCVSIIFTQKDAQDG